MKKFALLVLFGTLLSIACAPAPQPTEKNEPPEESKLIARSVLFGNPDKAGPQISPDGKYISWLAPVDGVLNVWVAPAGDLSKAEPVTADKKRGIRFYGWTYLESTLVYSQDKGGDENWRLYAVNAQSKAVTDLTPFDGVQARMIQVSHKFPKEVVVGLNNRKPELHDVYRLNLESGEMKLIQQNDGFVGFNVDENYDVRFATKATAEGGWEILQPAKKGWETWMEIGREDALTTDIIGFDLKGTSVYLRDSRDRDTAVLRKVLLGQEDSTKLLARDDRADLGAVVRHPTKKHVQMVTFDYDRRKYQILDKSISADIALLKTLSSGDLNIGSRTLEDDQWIVSFEVDDGPVRYYRYTRKTRKAQFLFTNRAELENVRLSKMHPVVIKSRDGKNLVSYLTIPSERDQNNDARPDAGPIPMVLWVHGGPWARDRWGYDSVHQWLSNRGYAVLSVNYRGSTGFGKSFTNSGDMEWAGTMHDDLIDAVDWAIAEKIADPAKVAIGGGSYGGYATLVGVTFTPDKFACGVDIVGPSNLETLISSIPPYWKPMLDLFATRVGDPRTEEGKKHLQERSPLNKVDNIKKPLLIGQGANDPRVKQAESDQIVDAMKAKSIPVTYVLFPDEGHGFARPENRLAFFAVAEAFLAQHLGGRYEPIGKAFEGSSVKVPEGADGIPGVSEALPGT